MAESEPKVTTTVEGSVAKCRFKSQGKIDPNNSAKGTIPLTYVSADIDFSACSPAAILTLAAAQVKILESNGIKNHLFEHGTVIEGVEVGDDGKEVKTLEWDDELPSDVTHFTFNITDAYVFDRTKRGESEESKKVKAAIAEMIRRGVSMADILAKLN